MVQLIRSIMALLVLAIVSCIPANGHAQGCPPISGDVPTVPGVVSYKTDHCAPVITGTDEAWRPDATHPAPQYTHYGASSGCCDSGSFTWTITGTGVQINPQNGTVTLEPNACGSFTATASDSCDHSASKTVRIANAGHWEWCSGCTDGAFECFTFIDKACGSERSEIAFRCTWIDTPKLCTGCGRDEADDHCAASEWYTQAVLCAMSKYRWACIE